MTIPKAFVFAVLGLGAAAMVPVRAGTFSNDFNGGTTAPPGTTLNGSAVIEGTGGVNNSGVLKLTKREQLRCTSSDGCSQRGPGGVHGRRCGWRTARIWVHSHIRCARGWG